MFTRLLRRLNYWLHRDRYEAELHEEMEYHREKTGGPAFGNALLAREDARGVWLAPWLESVWQDVRIGGRLLRRSPVATIVAVATMALGIGANTAVYSLIDGAMFRTMPVPEPDRLVFFTQATTSGPDTRDFTLATFEQLRDNNSTLSGLAAYDDSRVSATIDGQPEMVRGDFVSAGYFEVMRTSAAIGRLLVPADDRPGSPGVLVISDEYWRGRCGADPAVVGRAIVLGGMPFTIVGVTPATYHGRYVSGRATDVTIPLAAHASLALHDHTTFNMVGRLRAGVTIEQASADLDGIYRRVLASDRDAAILDARRGQVGLSPGAHGEIGGKLGPNDQRQVVTVASIVALVLVVACVNVATLLLARGAARRKEIAVRLSIGAGSARLIRQLLTESLLLAALGGIAALLVARSTATILLHTLPLPDLTFNPSRDAAALVFTAGVSVLSGLLFGIAPALASLRIDVSAMLKGGELHRAAPRKPGRAVASLVVAQAALSIALLVSTGLLVRSLGNLRRVDPGVTADRVLRAGIYPALLRYDRPREDQLYRTLRQTLGATPGIESAAVIRYALHHAGVNYVSTGLFATLGVPVTEGRDLNEIEVMARAHIAVINETAASQWYPGERAIGRLVPREFAESLAPLTIVGVVPAINPSYHRPQPRPAWFLPYTLASNEDLGQADLYVRTRTDAATLASTVRSAVRAVEPQLALLDLEPLTVDLEDSIAEWRATTALLGVCGALALALVALGLYGTMSQAVARRTRELGIRLSLGARPAAMLMMVLRETAWIAALGLAIGIPLAILSTRGLSHLLFGVGPADPVTLATVAVLTLAVALAAGYLPARRAACVDPVIALRAE
jgi:predicted permease